MGEGNLLCLYLLALSRHHAVDATDDAAYQWQHEHGWNASAGFPKHASTSWWATGLDDAADDQHPWLGHDSQDFHTRDWDARRSCHGCTSYVRSILAKWLPARTNELHAQHELDACHGRCFVILVAISPMSWPILRQDCRGDLTSHRRFLGDCHARALLSQARAPCSGNALHESHLHRTLVNVDAVILSEGLAGGTSFQMPPAPTQGPPLAMQGQYMPNVSRPQMTSVANPPVVAGNIQYGPSYKMQYQRRSTADKSAVKYTGFLPLEGVYEEDTCRIGGRHPDSAEGGRVPYVMKKARSGVSTSTTASLAAESSDAMFARGDDGDREGFLREEVPSGMWCCSAHCSKDFLPQLSAVPRVPSRDICLGLADLTNIQPNFNGIWQGTWHETSPSDDSRTISFLDMY
eukprot:s8667_g1.t2